MTDSALMTKEKIAALIEQLGKAHAAAALGEQVSADVIREAAAALQAQQDEIGRLRADRVHPCANQSLQIGLSAVRRET